MKHLTKVMVPLVLAVTAAMAPSSFAQGMSGNMHSGSSGMGYEATQEMQRYRAMADLMRDMSRQMNRMQTAMGKGGMSGEPQKRMQRQLKEMSELMTRMAGLQDRPSMNDPESKRQMEEMRKQMDEMMKSAP